MGKACTCGGGEWEEVLQVLQDGDIHGYQDPNHLVVHAGRQGMLEDGQLETGPDIEMDDGGDEGSNIDLLHKTCTCRDRTGETCHTLSWIWTTKSRSPNPSDEGDDILRAEWAKSWARAVRCQEEVLLLREEMRQVLAFLKWKSKWWLDRRNLQGDVTGDLLEGLQAYAQTQGDLQQALKDHFCAIWQSPLTNSDDISDLEGNDKNNDYDDDNDDDDNEDDDDDAEGDGLEGVNDEACEGADVDDNDEDAEELG